MKSFNDAQPTINVDRSNLFKELGKSFSTKEFENVCFDFGIELEEELEIATKEIGSKVKGLSSRPIYRIDIPANRIDLLCPEGLTRALKVYLGFINAPSYKVLIPENIVQLNVKTETAQIRPFVVAAILRNISFTPNSYQNFIDLQEKLHQNICRKRTLVAIGTHDLDTIEGPFSYEALPPKDIKFIPLNQEIEMDGLGLMEFYETDRRLSKFLPIISSSPVFPVIYDSKRRGLSLPPIINSDHSKIKLATKNVFIECTATDLTKAKIVLNNVVMMFSQYCKDEFTVEAVQVNMPDSHGSKIYPDLSSRDVETSVSYISSKIGVPKSKLPADKICELLGKMSLQAKNIDNENLIVTVPPTRSDVLHPCDIMEDVAIAFGYDNIGATVAAPFPLNKLSDQLREECARAGYSEVLPLILCSHDENFLYLQKVDDQTEAVKLANPKTQEYQVVRTSLIPGILKTIKENRRQPMPLRLFELSDVVFKQDDLERRARNQRNLCAVFSGTVSGFEQIHGLIDRIFAMVDIKSVPVGQTGGYYIREGDHPTFFPGRRADVFLNNQIIGNYGIIHPLVLEKFDIPFPTSCLELNIENFL